MPLFQTARFKRPDTWFSLIVFILVVWGLISVYSASVVISLENYGHPYYYLIKQAISLGIGILAWLITQYIDYHKLKRFAPLFLLLSVIFLVLVLLPIKSISPSIGGAKRWLFFGPINFQPSELVKIFFIVFLASWLSSRREEISNFLKGTLPFWILIGLVSLLVLLQPDLGTALILLGTGLILYFIAGARWPHFLLILIVGAVLVIILSLSSPYRMHRLLAFFNPSVDPLGVGYHSRNISIAVGSGGLWGQGFGNSKQKYFYLPEAHTDSIFAVIAEELGFVRALFIPLLFALLVWRGILISQKAPDEFGRFLAIGITAWFALQAMINLGGMLGVLPLTGVPLPFMSYGGTSLVISLIAMGILLNISRQRKEI